MSLTNTVVTAAVANVTSGITHLSLHTADPGGTGASEATGGSPAYARKSTTWTAGVSDQVTFDVPAGTYTHFGMWSASTGGTFRGGGALDSSEVYTTQGQMKLTVTINGTSS